jgi:peptide-methionine (R)-S-oxide reductase
MTARKTFGPSSEIEIASRRTFLGYALASVAVAAPIGSALSTTVSGPKQTTDVSIENFSAAGKSEGIVRVAKLIKTDADWRAQLSSDSYQVTRHEGTERPFSGKYDHNSADGLYRCICCGTALYDSKAKFDSGTGWPSFWQSISKANVVETEDRSLFMARIAVSCRRCDAHLGHVFDDGPRPTGLRYCMNSVALNFVARA